MAVYNEYLYQNMEKQITIPFAFLIFVQFLSQVIEKQTNLNSNMVPTRLNFSAGKNPATVGISIFRFPLKFGLYSSNNEQAQKWFI